MIARTIAPFVSDVLKEYAVVTILGPRQSGKTTLVKGLFKDFDYVNLEDPDDRRAAMEDGASFIARHNGPVIIDEVQRVPELLSRIQVEVDANPKFKGRFVLTGSHQPALREALSQSLAGRVAVCTLLPFSISELRAAGFAPSREDFIFKGFMPRIYDEQATPQWLYANYVSTYVERDINQIVRLKDKSVFEAFLRLVAGRVGQLVNCESIANEIGVSSVTVKSWLSVLEACYITFTLPCYYRNWGKRFVKTPKIYFVDVGLACHLLGIRKVEDVATHPLFGGLFENMVVAEALKSRLNHGLSPDMYFIRTAKGVEADLVIEDGASLDLFEIKSSASFSSEFSKNLVKLREVIPDVRSAKVIYSGRESLANGVEYVDFRSVF